MSAQRAGSAAEVDHRSIHPNIPGVPWYAALLIAITATAIGYGIDAGQKELTHVFAGFYIAGCVVAVLAVRQDGVFTTIIQPPLILFCAVPGSYWLFHEGKVGNLKDLLINCGYPLIERFPLMLGTAGGVLLIGLFRWYFGMSHRTTTDSPDDAGAAPTAEPTSAIGALAAKLNSLLRLTSHEDDPDAAASTVAKRTRANGPRPKATPRNDRAARGGGSAARPDRARARRAQPPRDDRREPRGRGNPYERPAPRGSRFDSYEPPYDPPRRRPSPGANPTHHPISRVRYRGEGPVPEPRGEPHAERRSRSRTPRGSSAESWEYDG